jgi:hypothetical protein
VPEEVRTPWLHGPVHDWFVVPDWLHQRMHDEGVEHEHRPVPATLTVSEPMDPGWWRCPLRRCGHGMLLHDGDGIDEDWTCCADGCPCRGSFDDVAPLVEQRGR